MKELTFKNLMHVLPFLALICISNMPLIAQNNIEPKPNWEIFYGDSLILKSHIEVRNNEKPTATIRLSEAKDLKIKVNTFELNSGKFDSEVKLMVDDTVVISQWGFGENYSIKHKELIKLEGYKGKRAMIFYYEVNYQKTPTLLGYVLIM
jgi:hypothetical protein